MLNPLKIHYLIAKTCDRSLHYSFCCANNERLRYRLYADTYTTSNTIEDALVNSLKGVNSNA